MTHTPDTKAPAREWPDATRIYIDANGLRWVNEEDVHDAFEEMRRERDEAVEMADLRAKQVKLELERIADFKRANAELRASLLESQSYQDELNKREILMKESLKEAYTMLQEFRTGWNGEDDYNNEEVIELSDNLLKRHEWLGDEG